MGSSSTTDLNDSKVVVGIDCNTVGAAKTKLVKIKAEKMNCFEVNMA